MLSATLKQKLNDCEIRLTRADSPALQSWIKGERAGLMQAYLIVREAEQCPVTANAAA